MSTKAPGGNSRCVRKYDKTMKILIFSVLISYKSVIHGKAAGYSSKIYLKHDRMLLLTKFFTQKTVI